MASERTVTLKFTDLLTDAIPDEKLNSDDLGFVITELMNSGGIKDVSVTVSDVKRDVPQTSGDEEAITAIQDSILATVSSLLGLGSLADHEHDEQGNCIL